jgi:hypothetical protein
MGQHYTLDTVEVSAWCSKCGKFTPHRVAARRLQYCIPCFDRLPASKVPAAEKVELQTALFDVAEVR